ncbi:MAG: hypothetical protein JNK69_03745 [Saprospiraceae bacterium]|nr:hypothetical protein [Saprospiraceae bacterium]
MPNPYIFPAPIQTVSGPFIKIFSAIDRQLRTSKSRVVNPCKSGLGIDACGFKPEQNPIQ